MQITNFIINNSEKSLTINFAKGKAACLTFEYLRVFPAREHNAKQKEPLVTHKKLVALTTIEIVAKHGYRLVFDDQHSAIYSAEYLKLLAQEYQPRWQSYLAELTASGQSREAMINFTQL